jgi:hypothetical protein
MKKMEREKILCFKQRLMKPKGLIEEHSQAKENDSKAVD